jgi:hypothetical protein
MGSYVGHAYDGKKPRVATDIYASTRVEGKNVKVVARAVPHTAECKPENQYGKSRIIAGGKGKK